MELSVTDYRLFRMRGCPTPPMPADLVHQWWAEWLEECIWEVEDDGHDKPLTLRADKDMIVLMQHRAANTP